MALLVPDVGEAALLRMMLKDAAPEAMVLKLYKNDHDPAEDDDAGDYTEADLAGYAAQNLVRATWGDPATVAGVTTATYPQVTFAFTGNGKVVGYFLVGATSGVLLWAERLFGPSDYPAAGQQFGGGDSLKFSPRIQLG
jgi:hypothetical protein